MGFGATHHALAPPILDDALKRFGTRPVESVERAGCDIAVELGAVGGQAGAKAVEHLDRYRQVNGFGVPGRLSEDHADCSQSSLSSSPLSAGGHRLRRLALFP